MSDSPSPLIICPAREQDFDDIWSIFHRIVQTADSYCNPADTTKTQAYAKWMAEEGTESFVARYEGQIAGSYLLKANRVGYGAHVANAAFIVSPDYRGKQIGRSLGEHALAAAKSRNFLAMQFNFVVSTNMPAVKLWKSLGFSIIGTIPKGFQHGTLGLVDAYIMHRFL